MILSRVNRTQSNLKPVMNDKKGKVYVASMIMRGDWYDVSNIKNVIKVNVTSAQRHERIDKKTFSPMIMPEGGYKGYRNFEAYWQAGKVHEGIPHEETKQWWKEIKVNKRRYPGNHRVLYATYDDDNKQLGYIDARKKVYVPEYYNLVKDSKRIRELQSLVESGKNVVVYDFDGPRKTITKRDEEKYVTENGLNLNEKKDKAKLKKWKRNSSVDILEVSPENLKTKINDPAFPFGHGYVVAGLIANLDYRTYI